MQRKGLNRKMTVSELVFDHTPHCDQVALIAPGRQGLTYGDLQRQLQKIIDKLRWAGIGRGDRVIIVLANGPALAAALLAASSCATSVPFSPAYTETELDYFLSQLSPRAVIVAGNTICAARNVAIAQGIPIIELNADPAAPAGIFELDCKKTVSATDTTSPTHEDTVLLLPTSGTTSRPKLVPLTNANLMSSVGCIIDSLHLTSRDRCLNILPLFHIHGIVAALLASLASGGSVACAPGCLEEKFFDWLREFKPSWYTAVPTMHQAILSRSASHPQIARKTSLRFIRSSSAPLPPFVMRELENVFGVPVIEAYGMTEASHQITSNPLPPLERKPGSVGLAAGPQVVVVDTDGNILPPNETGEVAIRGQTVTSGYENDAQINTTAFTRGWFRTGDLGRIETDGYLYLTGRIGDVVNRGGMMITPIEVDEALMTHPDIEHAISFAVPHPTLSQDLVAAVVPRERDCLSESEIREFALSRLAAFKVPSQVILIDEIPISATGKISRKKLANALRQHLDRDYVEPRDAIEALVADIYREVLRLKRVGVNDNFFLLGGDSLTAGQVVSRIVSLFQVAMPISTIFEKPTVLEFASEIRAAIERVGNTKLIETLTEIESLSEENIDSLLAAESSDGLSKY